VFSASLTRTAPEASFLRSNARKRYPSVTSSRTDGFPSVPASVPPSVPASVPPSVPASVPASVPTSVPASVPTSVPASVPAQCPSLANLKRSPHHDAPVAPCLTLPLPTYWLLIIPSHYYYLFLILPEYYLLIDAYTTQPPHHE